MPVSKAKSQTPEYKAKHTAEVRAFLARMAGDEDFQKLRKLTRRIYVTRQQLDLYTAHVAALERRLFELLAERKHIHEARGRFTRGRGAYRKRQFPKD